MNDAPTQARWYGVAEQDPIHIAATEWFLRLQELDLPSKEALAWRRWMDADAKHTAAFARIEAVWTEPWEAIGTRKMKPPKLRRAVPLALAASLTILAVVISWIVSKNPLQWREGSGALVQTAVGENRAQQLADGSRVMLGGYTQIRVFYDAQLRRIELLRGEALFTVAKDVSRPFVVDAGEAAVTALGTAFNVRRTKDRTVVAVVDGRVMVANSAPPTSMSWLRRNRAQAEPVQLGAGQQAIAEKAGVRSTQALADPAAATAWQTGQLAFREEPLKYVIEDVNRYSRKPVVIEETKDMGARIGEIRVTGTVLGDSVEGWIASLESAFAIEASEEPERIVLKRRDIARR